VARDDREVWLKAFDFIFPLWSNGPMKRDLEASVIPEDELDKKTSLN
jgi:hypothetical protein